MRAIYRVFVVSPKSGDSGICSAFRADSRFVPSQWETALLCNAVSHWLGTIPVLWSQWSGSSLVQVMVCHLLSAITSIDADLFSKRRQRTNFSEILIKLQKQQNTFARMGIPMTTYNSFGLKTRFYNGKENHTWNISNKRNHPLKQGDWSSYFKV